MKGKHRGAGVALLALALAAPAAAEPPDRVVSRTIDPATGLSIRVLSVGGGGMAVETNDGALVVRATVSASGTLATVRRGTARVDITVDGRGATLVAGARRIQAADREGIAEVGRFLAGSRLAQDGARLLGRLQLGTDAPTGHLLLLTRVLLSAGAAGDAALGQTRAWGAERPRPVRAILAAAQSDPGDCWNRYSREAIKVFDEYTDCIVNEEWWDVAGRANCALIYTMRALGAFTWYINCVGPIPFK